MAKKIDDFYRKALWYTSLTTSDFPYIYSSGGNFGFLEVLHDVYVKLIKDIVATGGDHFMEKSTFSLVADQQEYTFPADLLKLRQLELAYDTGASVWAKAIERDLSTLPNLTEAATLSAASTSSPLFDVLEDSYFIYPEPQDSVTNGGKLWYIKAPAESLYISAISAASATLNFPQEYDWLIPLGVSIELWGKYGQLEQKAQEVARYEAGVEKMKSELTPRTRTGSRRIRETRELGMLD